jgi:D-glycero-alpha-D-manno-heptose 1-phosphate guanylyltransferase
MRQTDSALMLPLFVLAGGFGTRLKPILDGFPKALAPVNGRPFLYLQIEHWLKQGCTSLIFLLHHHADAVINFLDSEKNKLLKDCDVQYIVEPEPMGTGGAISYALERLAFKGDFLLTNADTWLGLGLVEIMEVDSPAILVVKVEDVGRYGEVIFDHGNLITKFIEKGVSQNSGWINAGICRMNTSYFEGWNCRPFSIEQATFQRLVLEHCLRAVPVDTDFIDIGIPEDYGHFCRWVESGKRVRL